ncbi:MAG: hypothetical protein KBC21_04445, partial [Candidatus Pacebacteria bacterium]|nr:hypothetical protein [Candidatus Paceibacterota bacterium]
MELTPLTSQVSQQPIVSPASPGLSIPTVSRNSFASLPGVNFWIALLIGLVIGGGAAASYFLFLVPPPEPVVVEKIVIQQATTTEQVKSMVPAKTYDFRIIKVLNDDGATTTLSVEDSKVVEEVETLLKKDKDYYTPHSIVISSSSTLVRVGVPKDSGGEVDFVVDLVNKKITDKFAGPRSYYMDTGTFIIGGYTGELRYYSYGATSSVKLLNSELTGDQTYREYEGPMGSAGFQVVSTTTNS